MPISDETELLSGFIPGASDDPGYSHELRTAPLFTRSAYIRSNLHSQVATLERTTRQLKSATKECILTPYDFRVSFRALAPHLHPQDAPLSAVVCGVQGSGKSHTVSILLENMLIPNCIATGKLVKPLSGLVFHFGETGASAKPCEAAFLASSSHEGIQAPPICVYVSPGCVRRMTRVYGALDGDIRVEPLYFAEAELDAQAFLSIMAVGSSDSAPLYMQSVMSLLRELGEDYTYASFMRRLEKLIEDMNPMQKASLKQRMELLRVFTQTTSSVSSKPILYTMSKDRFAQGQITIIDLSDPFLDPPAACGIFEIILRIFDRADVGTGKVLVVDEAHKYLSQTRSSSGLTGALLTVIREQRHRSMRVIVSTQEPTILPPVFLSLCPIVIMHRFSSSSWWEHLSKHVAGDPSGSDIFDKVVQLQTGEALLLAPTGLGLMNIPWVVEDTTVKVESPSLVKFGRRFLLLKTRKRVTNDGGVSMLVVDRIDCK
ncbi:hypothetical protein OF83DRAFT_1080696 [Amylostereum chailletii]|nr:hypothetical protein OF83DRAFT_1080696 [Amylostereum chailletii]